MQVKLLCTYYHADGVASPGETLDLDDSTAQALLDAGLASVAETAAPAKAARKGAAA